MSFTCIHRVIIINKQKVVKVPVGLRMLVRRVCNSVFRREDFSKSADVSVIFVDNAYIQDLNKRYCNKDVPTNLLSFSTLKDGEFEVNPETGAKIIGDIIISLEKAKTTVDESYGGGLILSLEELVMSWTAHGLLHLLGYNHEKSCSDNMQMIEKVNNVMNLVGFSRSRLTI